MSYFSKNLKYLRKKENLSRIELAGKLNVNPSTISRWENEDMGVTVENAFDIAEFFNISIADLTGLDLSVNGIPPSNKTDILYNKTKDILNDDERAMMEFTMQRAIDRHEGEKREKNNDGEK